MFGSERSEEADKILQQKGLYAFGQNFGDIQAHHIDGNITNNVPENLQIVTKK
jgi:hypothetical protein